MYVIALLNQQYPMQSENWIRTGAALDGFMLAQHFVNTSILYVTSWLDYNKK